jgi:hypothetical protein
MSLLIQTVHVLGGGAGQGAADAAAQAAQHGPSFNLGNGEAPPGSDGIVTGLKWIFYVVCAIAVAGALGLGGKMLWSALRDGHGHGHVDSMGWYLMGCLIIASATGIPAALM